MSTSTSPTSASRRPTSPATTADRLALAFRRGWTPPPRISVPDWADRYRKLAKEAGSSSGKWNTATVEVARGPMLAVTEPGVHIVTTMCCTQLMKTALLENVFGYFAHLDPAPMLLLQPKEDAAEQFSKERITPLVKATPVLRRLVGSGKTRTGDETLLYKAFPGGFLALAGAGSPDNLARRPIRVLLCDEVDKYPVTREGDPITLAEERTATFGANWLSLRACSPTVEDESRIEDSYKLSDRRRASVVCPHCDHRQFLDFHRHVLPHVRQVDGKPDPSSAAVVCDHCGCAWSEGERLRALRTTRWHQTKPFTCCGELQVPLDEYDRACAAPDGEHADPVAKVWDWTAGPRHAVYRASCRTCGTWPVPNTHAGFQAGKMFSPWPKDRPADIAGKWFDAQGNEEKLTAWWNTQAGMPYRPRSGKTLQLEALAARGEVWDAEIPQGVAVLTCGVDTQDDRLELEVIGWGRNEESWSIAHEVLEGDPTQPEVWELLDKFLQRRWHRADGRPFAISATCVDSGGHATQSVYDFSKARLGRKIWAIKGESAQFGARNPVWPVKRPTARTKSSFRPVVLGVNAAKDLVRSRLQIEKPTSTYDGPLAGYMHVPADRDINWYAHLLAERSVLKEKGGKRYRVWEPIPGRRNEGLDCRVYGYAALCGLQHGGLKLNRRADDVAAPYEVPAGERRAAPEVPAAAAVSPPKPSQPARRSRWVT